VRPVKRTNLNPVICAGKSFTVGNKTYSIQGIYIDTLSTFQSCDSIITTNLTVIQPITINLNQNICQGDTFKVGTKNYTFSGQYKDTLQSSKGCDSIIVLSLTVNPIFSKTQNPAICQGESFIVGNKIYSISGTYRDTLLTNKGCDSILVTNLIVIAPKRISLSPTICSGSSFTVGNKTYTQAGTYIDTLTTYQFCDSIITTTLSVISSFKITLTPKICPGANFTVGNNIYSQSGTYIDTLKSVANCDSIITTSLTVLAPNIQNISRSICQGDSIKVGIRIYKVAGSYKDTLKSYLNCDSIVQLTLTVNPVFSKTLNPTICQGSSFQVGNKFYILSGNYKDTLKSIRGCDSIITTNLSVIPPKRTTISPTICAGTGFTVGNKTYTQTGNYIDTLGSSQFCDSIVTTNLTVITVFNINLNPSICFGETYVVGNNSYSQAGTYRDTLRSSAGCDSIIRTVLTVKQATDQQVNRSICKGSSITIGNSVYTQNGQYLDTLKSVIGCDSIIRLTLSIIEPKEVTISPSICEGTAFIVGTKQYTLAGNYKDTLVASSGCDSIVNTLLSIKSISNITINPVICQGEIFTVGNKNYTISGNYKDTLLNNLGCDSIITTNLTVNSKKTTSLNISICLGKSFQVGNSIYTTSGNYKDTLRTLSGCDSIVNLQLSVLTALTTSQSLSICNGDSIRVGNNIYKFSGTYKDTLVSSGGCDSIITTQLSIKPIYNLNTTRSICSNDSLLFGGVYLKTSGNYTFKYTSSRGCDSTVNLTLNVIQAFINQQTLRSCQGKTIVVNGNSYTQNITFSDSLKGTLGCDSIIVYQLIFSPVNVVNIAKNVCIGSKYENITISKDTLLVKKLININNCDSTVNISITARPLQLTKVKSAVCKGTLYRQTIITKDTILTQVLQSVYGCDSTVIDTITALTPPVLVVSKDTLINPGNNITLFASGATTYSWNTGSTQSTISVNPVQSTLYTVIGKAQNGCTDTANIQVDVNACEISAPTLFSPNGDGTHDKFKIKGGECLRTYLLQIVNRWGDVVFETSDITEFWDGSFKGQASPEGVYFYVITGVTVVNDNAVKVSGYVHLKR
jgi:gliding motility-associated-like protein